MPPFFKFYKKQVLHLLKKPRPTKFVTAKEWASFPVKNVDRAAIADQAPNGEVQIVNPANGKSGCSQ